MSFADSSPIQPQHSTNLAGIANSNIPAVENSILSQIARNYTEQTDTTLAADEMLAHWNLIQMYGEGLLQARMRPDMELRTLPERLATLLVGLSDAKGSLHGIRYRVFAEHLGTSRETVAAILRSFRRQGFVDLHPGRIDIVDRPSLQEMAEL